MADLIRSSARRRFAALGAVSRQRRSSASVRPAQSQVHLWDFNADGKIDRMRHYVDTAKHIAAERGEDTTRA